MPRTDITFDLLKNKTWNLRLLALDKFVQTARKVCFRLTSFVLNIYLIFKNLKKVIIKNRLNRVLSMLRKFINSWNETLSEPYINNGNYFLQ